MDSSGTTALSGVTKVAVNGTHTCALSNNSMYCWGDNAFQQLGNANLTSAVNPLPVAVLGLPQGNISSIAAGLEHSCVATAAGAVWCWGANSVGQLGNGSYSSEPTPTPTLAAFSGCGSLSNITAGGYHTCAIAAQHTGCGNGGVTPGSVWCWGEDDYGEVGNGSLSTAVLAPTQVQSISSMTAIAGGVWHTCALNPYGLTCWGYNQFGQLGIGTTTNEDIPVAVHFF
jgi:alpha-tubulin suppressor-like RCC1 family protein